MKAKTTICQLITRPKQAFIYIRLRPGRAGNWRLVADQSGHAYGLLRPNVTSFMKPEVHNIAQRRPRRTEPRPQRICTKISWRSVERFEGYARGQTDRQTEWLTRRQMDWSQYSAPLPRRSKEWSQYCLWRLEITAHETITFIIWQIVANKVFKTYNNVGLVKYL